MVMKGFIIELFEYNHWCNDRLIEKSLEFGAEISERTQKLFSHILNAHAIWNSRILNQPSEFGVWQNHVLTDWKAIHQNNFETSLSIIEDYDFEFKVNYVNSSGDSFENSVRDILFHIINHSTHHRAQIATDFRENDLQPLLTDYIFYKR